MVVPLTILLMIFTGVQPSVVPAGTRVSATMQTEVGTDTSGIGDTVIALVNSPIQVADHTVVPKGSRLHGRVELVRAATVDLEGWMRLVFREIQFADDFRVSTWMTNSFTATQPRHIARNIIYAGLGAAAGALIGRGRSRTAAVLGGVFGGFILSTNTGRGARDVNLKTGDTIWLQLGQDLTLPPRVKPPPREDRGSSTSFSSTIPK